MDKNGVVKIIDFGLAREAGVDAKTKSITGTIGYMAPELYGSSTISFSSAVDVYAFGWTALALLGLAPKVDKPKAVPKGSVLSNFKTMNPVIASVIEASLEISPANRPSMSDVATLLGQDLIRDRHRASIVREGSEVFQIHSQKRSATISSAVGKITIQYDGLKFFISSVTGSVFVNNTPVKPGSAMLSSCVITIGDQGSSRAFLTFDVSNPEVAA